MRLKAWAAATIALALLAAALALTYSTPPAKARVRVVFAPFVAHLVSYAYLKGYVQGPEGVELEVVSSLQFNELLMAGGAEMGEMSTAAFAIAKERGLPLKIVAAAVVQGRDMGNALVFVRQGSDIRTPADLRGRRVAVPGLKTTTTAIFLSLLEKEYGVRPEDLNCVDTPLPQVPERLSRGDVDASLAFEAVAAHMYLSSDKYSLLWDVSRAFKERYGDYPVVSVVVVNEGLLRARAGSVEAAIDTLRRSLAWGMAHLDEVAEAWAKEHGGTLEQFTTCLSQFRVELYLSEGHVESIATVFTLLKEQGVIKHPPTREEAFAELLTK
ncbi:MAG: ABC transporter substrate-binding protein [Candidatus Nezhaarchaeota archaeon]|nr:ABC transporter substrate-binding protein [Candidatus Nezhaarchaeota archaeon]